MPAKKEVVIATAGGSETISAQSQCRLENNNVPAEVGSGLIDRTAYEARRNFAQNYRAGKPHKHQSYGKPHLKCCRRSGTGRYDRCKTTGNNPGDYSSTMNTGSRRTNHYHRRKGFSSVLAENTVTVNGKAAVVKEAQHQ